MFEYKLLKSGGGGMFKAGQIDEKKSQEALDKMSAEGWRLISAFVENAERKQHEHVHRLGAREEERRGMNTSHMSSETARCRSRGPGQPLGR